MGLDANLDNNIQTVLYAMSNSPWDLMRINNVYYVLNIFVTFT